MHVSDLVHIFILSVVVTVVVLIVIVVIVIAFPCLLLPVSAISQDELFHLGTQTCGRLAIVWKPGAASVTGDIWVERSAMYGLFIISDDSVVWNRLLHSYELPIPAQPVKRCVNRPGSVASSWQAAD